LGNKKNKILSLKKKREERENHLNNGHFQSNCQTVIIFSISISIFAIGQKEREEKTRQEEIYPSIRPNNKKRKENKGEKEIEYKTTIETKKWNKSFTLSRQRVDETVSSSTFLPS